MPFHIILQLASGSPIFHLSLNIALSEVGPYDRSKWSYTVTLINDLIYKWVSLGLFHPKINAVITGPYL